MATGGFFLIFNISGVYMYENKNQWGTQAKPRIFDSYEEAHKVCMEWGGIPKTRYEKQTCSRFIARVGDRVCAEFVDKEGRRIVWSDHPGFPATAGYGESAMRIK
jgi:hypothetical protein